MGLDEDTPTEEPSSLVRPYMWTRGRTSSNHELRLETLVSVDTGNVATAWSRISIEHRWIIETCQSPRSVAEVAATLVVPLGVARVLLSDLIEMRVIIVHDNQTSSPGGEPDLALMERVLAGLRQL